jgi:hypothetical protein
LFSNSPQNWSPIWHIWSSIAWVLTVPIGSCVKSLVPRVVLWGGGGTFKSGRSSGHWGHALEGNLGTLDPSSCLLLLGYEVSGFALPLVPTTLCFLSTDPKQKDQPVIDCNLQTCESNIPFSLVDFSQMFCHMTESWLTYLVILYQKTLL